MGMRFNRILLLAICASGLVVGAQVTSIPPVVMKIDKKPSLSFTGGSKSIITQAQISAAGESSLVDTLRQLGALQIQDASGNNSQALISLRGFGANASSNTLVLVNGIPLTNPDLAPPNLNAIPLYNIKYIEIMAGSESVLYGDQAVGGVINIVTRDDDKNGMAIYCDSGSYNEHNCHFTINHHADRLQLNASLMANHTDNYRDHNQYNQQLLLGVLKYPYQTGNITLNYQLTNEYMQYPGALTAAQVRQSRTQAANDTDYFKDWNGYIQFQQIAHLSDNWQLKAVLARRQMNGSGVLFSPFTQTRDANFLLLQVQGKWKSANVMTGVNVEDDGYHLGSLYGLTNENLQKYDLFGVATTPVTNDVNLSFGARGALQNSRLASTNTTYAINKAFATTLGVSYQFHANDTLYLRRAESFRFPKAEEDAATVPVGSQLRTQRGVAYESGVELNREAYSLKFGVYQLNLKDEIAFNPQQTTAAPFGTNQNLSPTKRSGLMLSGSDKINTKLTLTGQYNLVNAVFQSGINQGNRIPLVAENIVHAGIDYQLNANWDTYYEGVYTGSQYPANDNGNVAGKIGGYTTLNFNLRFVYHQLTASLHMNNLLNKDYYLYTVYQVSAPNELFYPAPGRNVTLSIQYLFT